MNSDAGPVFEIIIERNQMKPMEKRKANGKGKTELSGGSCLFPDFTIVDKDQRRLIYWEHFGMTDEFSYASKMAAKLAVYERNGIFPGDRLIMTMESRDCPLDVGLIKATIRKYLEQ